MILLIKKTKHGSGIELGDNLSSCISKHTESKSLFVRELINNVNNIKNSIIIFVKYLELDNNILNKIKNNNNKIYYMIVDKYPEKSIDFTFDGIIFSNKQQQKDFSQYFSFNSSYIYYHHYSPLYNENKYDKIKNIGYFVAPENVSKTLKQSKFVEIHNDFSLYKDYISSYKFHIEYRESSTNHFKYKPATKLSSSSFAESVFICSKDCSYKELLPTDYPFFLEDNLSINEIDQKLFDYISRYNDLDYNYALEIMKNLKKNLNIMSTSYGLYEFLK